RLRDVFNALARKGAYVMLSNSDTAAVRELYQGWDLRQVLARRSVGCTLESRASVHEVVIRSYA
ncbi:MAG TPA: hypothetical protein VMF89_29175, partial [Polyangiales bacterium]|nr:hypothetical protein [Polyangiales bacterium]